jgi:hypothetical protein
MHPALPDPPPATVRRVALEMLAHPGARAEMIEDPTIGYLVPVHRSGIPCTTRTVYPDAAPEFPESIAGAFATPAPDCQTGSSFAGWILATAATGHYNELGGWAGFPSGHARHRLSPASGPLAATLIIYTPAGLSGGLTSKGLVVWRVGLDGPSDYLADNGEMIRADHTIRWAPHLVPAFAVPPTMRSAAIEARR